ncbi:MAG TPA: ACT domain-containing protein [Clostridiales bacterium]|jgi:hypothetical protein|nr:ACT domain-containing protein [Clostridiales bacterium]
MIISQLSVFVQNESGRLVNVTGILEKAGINITALSLAETGEYGVLRMIVSDIEAAAAALRDANYIVKLTEVNCIVTPDVPGALNSCLEKLAEAGINLAYMYGYSSDQQARLVLKTSAAERTEEVLADCTTG